MSQKYESVADIFEGITYLRDQLLQAGASDAAAELSEVITSSWATASEAVGESKLSLEKVRPEVDARVPQASGLLAELSAAAQRLWDGA